MISIEEKLLVFKKSLLNKERKNGKKMIDEAKIKKEALVTDSLENIRKEKKNIENRSNRSIFRDRNKILAEGKNKAKAMELEARSRILLDFNQLIQAKAKEYLTPAGYRKYLSDCIETIPEIFGKKTQLVVFINQRDLNQIKALFETKLAAYTVEYREEIKETMGGMIVEDSDGRIYCDFTVENLIKTNYKTIGMMLNELMENKVV